jgi:hypothetical protein
MKKLKALIFTNFMLNQSQIALQEAIPNIFMKIQ